MRKPWMDAPHEFVEDVEDGSMCVCGVPALTHHLIEAPDQSDGGRDE